MLYEIEAIKRNYKFNDLRDVYISGHAIIYPNEAIKRNYKDLIIS